MGFSKVKWGVALALLTWFACPATAQSIAQSIQTTVPGSGMLVGHWPGHEDDCKPLFHKHRRSADRAAVLRTATILPLGSLGEERLLERDRGLDFPELRAAQRLERAAVEYNAVKAAHDAEMKVRGEALERSREIINRSMPMPRNNSEPARDSSRDSPPKPNSKSNEEGAEALTNRVVGLERRIDRLEEEIRELTRTQQELARRLSRPALPTLDAAR